MSYSGSSNDKADLYASAADWHTRMDDPAATVAERAEFDAWLAKDTRHAEAYRAIERMWSSTRKLAADPRILEFRREALSEAGNSQFSKRGLKLLAPIAAALVIGIVATWFAMPGWRERNMTTPALAQDSMRSFATAVGERSEVTLSDGSSVVLNTNTRLEVRFSPQQRHIRLLTGQAWFRVAKNPNRPFIVDAGDQRVTALGTAFDVRFDPDASNVQVTLVEGKVTVAAQHSALLQLFRVEPPVHIMTPGELLVIADDRPAVMAQADVARIVSWRDGQIMFDGEPLAKAIAEVNRYSTTAVELADPQLADLPVSGVFNAGYAQSFVETVSAHYGLAVTKRPDDSYVLARGSPAELAGQ